VFAPDDAALEGLPDEIFTDPTLAEQFVDGYVVNGALDLATLQQQGQVTTLGGQTLTISNDTVTGEDGAGQITAPDQAATNGFVQGINGVLFVPEVTPPTEPSTTGPECQFTENDELPIEQCDAGPAVAAAQAVLQALNYGIGTVDCLFGDQTADAVHAFQRDRGLEATGVIDQATWAALAESFPAGWGDDANGNDVIEPHEISLECG
jgi:hypothetical protein